MNFSLLIVCTGNICRSPAAERLLGQTLGPSVAVSSAGTRAMVGQPIAPPMASLIRSAGADPDHFHARLLTEGLVRDADLALAMTREHRAAVVEAWPGAVRRTFTLAEFARLLVAVDPESLPDGPMGVRLAASIPLAAAQRRGALQFPEHDDILDPFGGAEADYERAFSQIAGAVRAIDEVLNPS